MKAIQVVMDERLLAALDADDQVLERGRSAALRTIVREYLEAKRRAQISEQYRNAYGGAPDGLGEEYSGWEDEGAWPSL
jgi:metal-responsive CopG/Arc/MetJ family transcriptional regulator